LLYLKESEVIQLANQMFDAGIQRWVADLNSPTTLKAMARVWSLQLNQNIQFKFGHASAKKFFVTHNWEAMQELPVLEQAARFHRSTLSSKVREIF
jgi:hypothetical protein